MNDTDLYSEWKTLLPRYLCRIGWSLERDAVEILRRWIPDRVLQTLPPRCELHTYFQTWGSESGDVPMLVFNYPSGSLAYIGHAENLDNFAAIVRLAYVLFGIRNAMALGTDLQIHAFLQADGQVIFSAIGEVC